MPENTRTLNIRGHTTSTAHRLIHYDGACNAVHGHNMEWNVELTVIVPDEDHQMAVDFKDVSDVVDVFDHAIILNEDDPLAEHEELLGDVITIEGDPTCENITSRVAQQYVQGFERIISAEVEMAETDKYAMTGAAFNMNEPEEADEEEDEE